MLEFISGSGLTKSKIRDPKSIGPLLPTFIKNYHPSVYLVNKSLNNST